MPTISSPACVDSDGQSHVKRTAFVKTVTQWELFASLSTKIGWEQSAEVV
jgi:hypothetical protein